MRIIKTSALMLALASVMAISVPAQARLAANGRVLNGTELNSRILNNRVLNSRAPNTRASNTFRTNTVAGNGAVATISSIALKDGVRFSR